MEKKFKDFKLIDYFNINYGKFIKRNKVGDVPYITTTESNNGIGGSVEGEPMYGGNCITIASDGSVGSTFYQGRPFSASNIVVILEPKEGIPLNRHNAHYIATKIKLYAKYRYGYGHKYSVNRVRETELNLPTTESGELDWEYMEDYIKQKELAYIGKLNKEFEQKKEQLIELIGEESEYINIEELPTAKFKVGDFMEMTPGKRVTKNKQVKGDVPYVTALTTNNGIDNYISNPPFIIENVITISFIGDGFYHPYKLSFKDGTYGFKLKEGYRETKLIYLYLLTSIEKQTKKVGSYSNAVRGEQIQDFEIELPINPEVSELEPDWETMEKYIARVELQLLNRVINT